MRILGTARVEQIAQQQKRQTSTIKQHLSAQDRSENQAKTWSMPLFPQTFSKETSPAPTKNLHCSSTPPRSRGPDFKLRSMP